MTEVYQFPSGDEQYGLSHCQPILDGREASGFQGALCMDLDPIAPVSNYFAVPLTQKSRTLLFNPDEVFDKASYEFYFLGIDWVNDRLRGLDGSQFQKLMEVLVDQTFDVNEYGFRMQVKSLAIEADQALLFGDEDDYVTWGEMELESRRKDNSTEKFIQYFENFIAQNDTESQQQFEKFLQDDWPTLEKDQGTVLGGLHPTYLYVVGDVKVTHDLMLMTDEEYSGIDAIVQARTAHGHKQAMKIGYFFDGSAVLAKAHEDEQ